jgi:uncharacterized protein (TIGR02246 family)
MTQSTENISDEIQRANDHWNSAFNSGNADAVAALYTQDAVVLPSTHAVVRGTSAIKDFWNGLISAGVKDHRIEMIDAQAVGDHFLLHRQCRPTLWTKAVKRSAMRELSSRSSGARGDGSWRACLHTWN